MKKLYDITILCLVGLSTLGQAQTPQVHIAGHDYPVVFEDATLSVTNRQRIASDLTLVFFPAPSFEKAMGGGGDEVEAATPLPGGNTAIANENGVDYWEGAFKPGRSSMLRGENREGIFLVDYGGQKSVRVTAVVSSNYVNSFVLMETHSNAVQKAHEFIALLNRPDLLAQPLQVLKGLHHLLPKEEGVGDDIYLGFATDLQNNNVLAFSALNFVVRQVSQLDNAELPIIGLFTVDKSDPSFIVSIPIIFHNGRWGFGKYWP